MLVEWSCSKRAVFRQAATSSTSCEVGADDVGFEPKLHHDFRLAVGAVDVERWPIRKCLDGPAKVRLSLM
jgi:hypothetical protein